MSDIRVSIVTVCYNAENSIAKTIESVLNQTYTNYEYIIVDGRSKDRTVKIAQNYNKQFAEKNISFKIISEKDEGIYNAMNKAVDMCYGTWIHYLNSGDMFASKDILNKIFGDDFNFTNESIIYGDYYKKYSDKEVLCKAYPLQQMKNRMCFCHQAVFTPRFLLNKNHFDESYKIAADHKMFLQLFLNQNKFEYIPQAIALFDCDGISQKDEIKLMKEEYRLKVECGVIAPNERGKEWIRCNIMCTKRKMQIIKREIVSWRKNIFKAN